MLGLTGCQTIERFRNGSIEKVNSARSWARDGFDAVKAGHLAKAQTCFSNAARDLPDDHRLMANIARTEYDQGSIPKAIETMEAALADSNDPLLRAELGEMHLAAGQWLAANRDVELALQSNYRLPAAWKLKGKLASAKGDNQAALSHFQRAMGFDPYAAEAEELQMLIAKTCLAMGRPMQALSATETLLSQYALDKQPEPVVLAKAEALLAMKQHAPAIDVLEMASRRAACSKHVFFRLGEAHMLAGQRDRAYATLERGRNAFPKENVFAELIAAVAPVGPTTAPANQMELYDPSAEKSVPHRVASVAAGLDLKNNETKSR